MAPKKRLLVDDPPSATSTASESSDDDKNNYIQLPSSSRKQPVVFEGEEEIGEADSDSSSSSNPFASQNPPPSTTISNAKTVASDESESGSDSEPKRTTRPNTKPKQLASKPKPQAHSPVQAQTTPKSGKKRVADDDNKANGHVAKRSKGKETVSAVAGGSAVENDDMEELRLTGEESKPFRRIFSEEDEIAILKGLIDFFPKTGKDPSKNIAAFHDFVKKSLHVTATDQQLKRKVRGLKEKYESSDSFNKSHEKKAFELFKKISWGNNGENVAGEEKGEAVSEKTTKKDVNVVKHVGSSSKNVESGVDNDFILNEILRFGDSMGLALNKDSGKKVLEMISESKRADMECKWRQLHVAEWEVFVNRSKFIKDQTRSILEELKKSIN